MGKKKYNIKDYINNLSAASMTGNWVPKNKWNRIHGDCKSTTGGTWHMETMGTKDGVYKVKIVPDYDEKFSLEYTYEPSFEEIVADLQARV
ncbi:hypothetical protein QBC38DRAFT_430167 [Podospora fimiseda]|uniref:Uncharacterized protein n=1 Tax=Podospora fimiseda TaxID=252190 RepID=A0AAN6YKI8_9PEZI|nr:hypothetical protein QBC38DRAFT_430167 [Podospora fimiseda]